MPRYFLHLDYRDQIVLDLEGSDCECVDDAKHEAMDSISQITAECFISNRRLGLVSVRICNSDGDELRSVPVADVLQRVIPSDLYAP
jgi:hypothetical protein